MSTDALAAALVAMVPTTLAPVHDGVVAPDTADGRRVVPAPPWVVANVRLPVGIERGEARRAQAWTVILSLTLTAGTARGCRQLYDSTVAQIEHERPVASGWTCGPLLAYPGMQPEVDTNLVFAGSLANPVFQVVEMVTTVSHAPEVP